MSEPTFTCPKCGSEQVTTIHVQMFMINTGDHYCHSVKTHDSNSEAKCLDCRWVGVRADLKEQP